MSVMTHARPAFRSFRERENGAVALKVDIDAIEHFEIEHFKIEHAEHLA